MNEDPVDVGQQHRITDNFRTYGRAYGELGRVFATSLGLHSTDALALVEVIGAEERGEPLSQSKLSHRIGLTTGATSSLLNRLETRGHITRSRVHEDRRIVTLHAAPDIHQTADDFFGPLGVHLAAMMATYPREVLEQVEKFVADLCLTMDDYIAERADLDAGRTTTP